MKFEKKNPQHAANVDGEIKRRKGGRPPTPKTSTVAAVAGWTGVHVRIRNGCSSQDEQEEGAAALHGRAARCVQALIVAKTDDVIGSIVSIALAIKDEDVINVFLPQVGDIGIFVSAAELWQQPSGLFLPAPSAPGVDIGVQWLMQPTLPSPLPPPEAVAALALSFNATIIAIGCRRQPHRLKVLHIDASVCGRRDKCRSESPAARLCVSLLCSCRKCTSVYASSRIKLFIRSAVT